MRAAWSTSTGLIPATFVTALVAMSIRHHSSALYTWTCGIVILGIDAEREAADAKHCWHDNLTLG